MRCPFCNDSNSKVIDSRTAREGREIRRRRECESCDRRYTTYERIEEMLPMVVKRDGNRQPFDRNKIESGLKRAVANRPIPVSALQELAEDVEKEVCDLGVKEIDASRVGDLVLPRLRALDQIAYVRYASIYRDFRDIDEFMIELAELMKARK